jgi:hypothetical protein
MAFKSCDYVAKGNSAAVVLKYVISVVGFGVYPDALKPVSDFNILAKETFLLCKAQVPSSEEQPARRHAAGCWADIAPRDIVPTELVRRRLNRNALTNEPAAPGGAQLAEGCWLYGERRRHGGKRLIVLSCLRCDRRGDGATGVTSADIGPVVMVPGSSFSSL